MNTNSQQTLESLFNIAKYYTHEFNKTNYIIKLNINPISSPKCEELFLTKKEKNNNKIYDLLITGISIGLIISGLLISALISPTNAMNNNVISDTSTTNLEIFGDIVGGIFGQFTGGCLSIIIIIILFIIAFPFFKFLEKKLVTTIKNIKLEFSSNGLAIIPDSPKKEKIFIESLNISTICIKEAEIIENHGKFKNKRKILNLILKLHKPIKNLTTNKEIEEIYLIEKINNENLGEAIKLAEEMQKSLELSV